MVLAFVAACQQGNAMYRALFEENFLGTFFLQKPNNFLSTFAVGRRARWLEAWSAGNRHSLAEPRSKSALSFAWTRGKSWHSGTAAPFSSPLQLASHDHVRLDPNGGRCPARLVARHTRRHVHAPAGRHMPISRWHAGPTSPHLPPATAISFRFFPLRPPYVPSAPSPPAPLSLPPLSARLSRTCPPSPLPFPPSLYLLARLLAGGCVRRPPQHWRRCSEARAPPTSRFLGSGSPGT
jgi:hypothetical protein